MAHTVFEFLIGSVLVAGFAASLTCVLFLAWIRLTHARSRSSILLALVGKEGVMVSNLAEQLKTQIPAWALPYHLKLMAAEETPFIVLGLAPPSVKRVDGDRRLCRLTAPGRVAMAKVTHS